MQINSNLSALFASRQLGGAGEALSRSLQRLSSGMRINSAKDDAAGLAISERMTGQFKGMNQAARNASDGISMLQTADGVLSSISNTVQRLRELAVQAANGTNSSSDRQALQMEASQLLSEVTRIGQESEFNGDKLFSQSKSSIGGDANKRAVLDGMRLGWLSNAESMVSQYYGITGKGDKMYIGLSDFTDGGGQIAAYVATPGPTGYVQQMQVDMADFTPPNLPNGGNAPLYNDRIIFHEMVHAVMNSAYGTARTAALATWFKEGTAEFAHGADERLAGDIAANGIANVVNRVAGAWGSSSIDYSSAYVAARYLHETMKTYGHAEGIKAVTTYLANNQSATLDQAISALTGGAVASAGAFIASFTGANSAVGVSFITNQMNLTNTDTGAIGGLDADNGAIRTAESVIDWGGGRGYDKKKVLDGFDVTFEDIGGGTGQRQASFQLGANAGQSMDVNLGAVNAFALGIDDVDLSSGSGATVAIVHLDDALNYINLQRANVGAQLSRMEFAISNLNSSAESLGASRSRIRDADYATETTALVRSQILQQAASSVLAQSNTSGQMVLSLLRGL